MTDEPEVFPTRKQAQAMVDRPREVAARICGGPAGELAIRFVELLGRFALEMPEGARLALGIAPSGRARLYAVTEGRDPFLEEMGHAQKAEALAVDRGEVERTVSDRDPRPIP